MDSAAAESQHDLRFRNLDKTLERLQEKVHNEYGRTAQPQDCKDVADALDAVLAWYQAEKTHNNALQYKACVDYMTFLFNLITRLLVTENYNFDEVFKQIDANYMNYVNRIQQACGNEGGSFLRAVNNLLTVINTKNAANAGSGKLIANIKYGVVGVTSSVPAFLKLIITISFITLAGLLLSKITSSRTNPIQFDTLPGLVKQGSVVPSISENVLRSQNVLTDTRFVSLNAGTELQDPTSADYVFKVLAGLGFLDYEANLNSCRQEAAILRDAVKYQGPMHENILMCLSSIIRSTDKAINVYTDIVRAFLYNPLLRFVESLTNNQALISKLQAVITTYSQKPYSVLKSECNTNPEMCPRPHPYANWPMIGSLISGDSSQRLLDAIRQSVYDNGSSSSISKVNNALAEFTYNLKAYLTHHQSKVNNLAVAVRVSSPPGQRNVALQKYGMTPLADSTSVLWQTYQLLYKVGVQTADTIQYYAAMNRLHDAISERPPNAAKIALAMNHSVVLNAIVTSTYITEAQSFLSTMVQQGLVSSGILSALAKAAEGAGLN